MTRWRFSRVVSGLLMLTAFLTSGCTPDSPKKQPSAPATQTAAGGPGYNVVLVSFDAMRARETSLFGYARKTTPNLDKFAESCIVFKNAIAPASWTLPATMAIFTGLFPSVHGVVNKLTLAPDGKLVDSTLSPTVGTLPQLLHKAGYILGGFTGDAGVSARFGFGRDFDTFVDDVKFGGFDHSQPPAEQWLEAHKDQRFFMFLHGYDCHGQYDPPQGYKRVFAADYKGSLKGDKEEQAGFRERALQHKFDSPTHEPGLTPAEFSEADARFYQALYDEKIQLADAHFAAFLKKLDALGLTDKTIIVVVADHGEEFMEHGNIDHGPTLYQEMIHVPVLMRIPGMAPRVVTQRISSMDALPTVLDVLKVATPRLDGMSLLPFLEGKTTDLPPVYSETDYRLFSHKRALLDGDYKIIHSLDTDRWELYNLKEDPDERKPTDPRTSEVGKALMRRLDDWVSSLPRRYQDYGSDPSKIIKIF